MGHPDLAEQIEPGKPENHHGEGDGHRPRYQPPPHDKVRIRQELEGGDKFHETQRDLNAMHPGARSGQRLQRLREQGERHERHGKRSREDHHTDDGIRPLAGRSGNSEQPPYKRNGAGKMHQRQGQPHEKCARIPRPLVALTIEIIDKTARQRQFEHAEQRKRKHGKYPPDEKIDPGIGRNGMRPGSAQQGGSQHPERREGKDDRRPEGQRHTNRFGTLRSMPRKPGDGQRDHGKYAGRQERGEPGPDRQQNKAP